MVIQRKDKRERVQETRIIIYGIGRINEYQRLAIQKDHSFVELVLRRSIV